MPRFSKQFCFHRRRGSVVAATLGLIILLSFLVVAFMEDARDQIRYHAQFQYSDDLRVEAYSALEATLAVLNVYHEVDGNLWAPEQGWGDPLAQADYIPARGMQVQVAFRDESGRFPINTVEPFTLRLFFEEWEVRGMDVERLIDGLLDWIDEDDAPRLNGFDGDDYRNLRPIGYEPANRPIRSWDELSLIKPYDELFFDENGLPLPIYYQFRETFSLNETETVNINAASPMVVRILERKGIINPYNLRDYKAGLDRTLGTDDDRVIRSTDVGGIFTNPESGLISTRIEMLEIAVTVTRGDASFLLRSLVSFRGANMSAGQTTPAARGATEQAVSREDRNATRRSRGSARTQASTAAQLGYPFQVYWIAENRQN